MWGKKKKWLHSPCILGKKLPNIKKKLPHFNLDLSLGLFLRVSTQGPYFIWVKLHSNKPTTLLNPRNGGSFTKNNFFTKRGFWINFLNSLLNVLDIGPIPQDLFDNQYWKKKKHWFFIKCSCSLFDLKFNIRNFNISNKISKQTKIYSLL